MQKLKNIEKILVGIIFIFFVLHFIPLSYYYKNIPTSIAIFSLALFYLFAGFWLFNKENKKTNIVFRIVAGIFFAMALFTLHYTTIINKSFITRLLVIPNILLFIILMYSVLINKLRRKQDKTKQTILLRSFIILLITASFEFSSIYNQTYREFMYAFSNGNESLRSNIKMFDFYEKGQNALESNDCDQAIIYAELAIEEGLNWLNDDLANNEVIKDTISNDEINKISGAYGLLYEAYSCKAENYYHFNKYKLAINYFEKAIDVLEYPNRNSYYNTTERSFTINYIALCYKKIGEYQISDSLYLEAIRIYLSVENKDRNVAVFYSNLAESLSDQLLFEEANALFDLANKLFKDDGQTSQNKQDILLNFDQKIRNCFSSGNYGDIAEIISEAYKLNLPASIALSRITLYEGLLYLSESKFSKAERVIDESLNSFIELEDESNKNILEFYLAKVQVSISRAKYDTALYYTEEGLNIAKQHYSIWSNEYANFIKQKAYINRILGNYKVSEELHKKTINIYSQIYGEKINNKSLIVISAYAEIQALLGNYEFAKRLSNEVLSFSRDKSIENHPNLAYVYNSAAFIQYCIEDYNSAEKLYNKALTINNNLNNGIKAATLNGLGLVNLSNLNYSSSNSLFQQSLNLHIKIFGDNHPNTAQLYLNIAELKIQQNKLEEAESLLLKADAIFKNYFDNKHDSFGDIYYLLGKIEAHRQKHISAKEYFNKAYSIYLNKFGQNHPKTLSAKVLLK